jgi:L-rhamnose-H+ transport protein
MGLIASAIFLVIIGGILNGSFAIPMKHMPHIKQEKLWFVFSWWAYLIIPIATFLILDHNFINIILCVAPSYIYVPLLGGLLWGLGMICMCFAFKHIGIGVVFVINIGIGTAGGALLPLIFIHPNRFLTFFGLFIVAGVILFIIGVISAGIAAKIRDDIKRTTLSNKNNLRPLLGIILSILAGISSAFQGFSYAYSASGFQTGKLLSSNSHLVVGNLPWLLIFLGGFLPYMIYFLIASLKRKSFGTTPDNRVSFKYHLMIFVMALLFFECALFYGKATLLIGALGPIIIWPIYMVFIVLTSNFWSFKYGEWKGSSALSKSIMAFAISVQIVAVVILAYAATLA